MAARPLTTPPEVRPPRRLQPFNIALPTRPEPAFVCRLAPRGSGQDLSAELFAHIGRGPLEVVQ